MLDPENLPSLSSEIKQKALELGFADCGMAPAKPLTEELPHLKSWVDHGYFGNMHYYGSHIDNRIDPQSVLPNAQSLITVVLPYFQIEEPQNNLKLARYARVKDYHNIIKPLLKQLLDFLTQKIPGLNGRLFCDSGAILEKAWAKQCGLGGIGKNSLFIHPQAGSFVFIGVLVIDALLDYDTPFSKDLCGNCTQCLCACPTQALVEPYVIDVRKCISYHTIESKEPMPKEFKGKMGGYVFGCDICQNVCPYNQKLTPIDLSNPLFDAQLSSVSAEDLKNLNSERFKQNFSGTAMERSGYQKLRQSIDFILE